MVAGAGAGEALFETKVAKGRFLYKIYGSSVFIGLCFIYAYRAAEILSFLSDDDARRSFFGYRHRFAPAAMFFAELWFGFYWIFTQSSRRKITRRSTFKQRLKSRIGDDELPFVDVFVCTADPEIEPPAMVADTVVSVMAYDYPPEKLAVYLSDDGGSELTFYAMIEAYGFAASWLPFCRRFEVKAASPAVFFSGDGAGAGVPEDEWLALKNLYEEMENRINGIAKLGRVPDEIREQHKGFLEWADSATMTSRDHKGILQILTHGGDEKDRDNEGSAMPKLVYVAREKRPYRHHNFKAGAMNALIRVSSEISDGEIILNVDCDMRSNNSELVRDALCFFMDEEKGHEYAFIQTAQHYTNVTKNDIYGSSLHLIREVDLHGIDGYDGVLYIGSGCFHRRVSLCGLKYSKDWMKNKRGASKKAKEETLPTSRSLEERAKPLVSCTFEDNTNWGKEVGLKYGCPVEDVITGLSIQCRGWKSIYYNPPRPGFVGLAPMTLSQALVQHKRWSEGDLQIFLSEHCPFVFGRGKIGLGLQMGYTVYCFWALCSFPTLFYVCIPSICLFGGIPVFPKVTSLWFLPFAYVIAITTLCNLGESIWVGMTPKGWWNEQRMWLYKRLASYPFAVVDTVLKFAGASKSAFVVTPKVADKEASERYEREVMEFGPPSLMLTILASVAVLSFAGVAGGLGRVALSGGGTEALGALFLQLFLAGSVTALNAPLYEAMVFRGDGGSVPASVTLSAFLPLVLLLALMLCP